MNSLDLTNCDRERIHEIPYIQGHGAFLVLSPLDTKIHFASENLTEFFKLSEKIHIYIGRKLHDVIGQELSVEIQRRLRSHDMGALKQTRFNYQKDFHLDVFIFAMDDGLFGVEFEKLENSEDHSTPSEEVLNQFVKRMHECKTLESLSLETCRAVRSLTGLDRVMMYKFFAPTMYGEVIAEDKVAAAHSFMAHRFPATDIPKPARDLYLRNHVRFIHDSEAPTFNIYPEQKKKVLNMSDSRLRGVSKIHTEYLKNMKVRSSFSVAVIVDGQLWGLIACHSSLPKNVTHTIRAQCETISNTYAMGASMFERLTAQTGELSFFNGLHHLYDKLRMSDNPLDQLFREGQEVLGLFKGHGMVLVNKEQVDLFGITPLPQDIKKLWNWVLAKMDDEGKNFVVADSLASLREEFTSLKDQVSGLMAIRLGEMSDSVLMIMRPEYMETIMWGGDPRKNIDARNYEGQINPRLSFETWTEVVKNTSKPWHSYEINGLNFFKNIVFKGLIEKENLLQELKAKLVKK